MQGPGPDGLWIWYYINNLSFGKHAEGQENESNTA